MSKPLLLAISPAMRPLAAHFDIATAFGLIEAFGGFDGASRSYDVAPEAARNWATTGNIPPGWHLQMFAHAWSLGKTTDPRVWGFEYQDPAFLSLSDLQWHARRSAELGGAHA